MTTAMVGLMLVLLLMGFPMLIPLIGAAMAKRSGAMAGNAHQVAAVMLILAATRHVGTATSR